MICLSDLISEKIKPPLLLLLLVKDHDGAAEDADDQVAGLGVTAAVSTRITIAAGVRVIRSLIFSNLLVFSYLHLLFLVNVFFLFRSV